MRDWEIEFKPNHIWNVDETGITDVPKERKVIGITGEHMFQAVADEKGTTTTVVSFASAGGLHVPPTVIFKAGRVKDIWREAGPSGYTIKCSESGYINADLFADYGANFLNFLKEKKTTRKWAEESTSSRFAQQPIIQCKIYVHDVGAQCRSMQFPPTLHPCTPAIRRCPLQCVEAEIPKGATHLQLQRHWRKNEPHAAVLSTCTSIYSGFQSRQQQKRIPANRDLPH